MLKCVPPVAMALCFSIIAFRLQHTDCPSPSPPLKYPRFFICLRSYFYYLSNSLFIAAATAIEAWVEIQCCQIWDLSSEVKTLLSDKRHHVSSQIARFVGFNFSSLVGSEKKLKKQLNILLLFWRILLSDCNKNKRIIDLYVCYGCYPQHVSQWYDKRQQMAAER